MARHLEDIAMGPHAEPSLPQGFRWKPSPRRVRVELGGVTIADSTRVMLLLEAGHLPVFYFPLADVRPGALERSDHATHSDLKGTATYWTVRGSATASSRTSPGATASRCTSPPRSPATSASSRSVPTRCGWTAPRSRARRRPGPGRNRRGSTSPRSARL